MADTPDQIRTNRQRLLDEIKELEAQIKVKRAEIGVVQARCKHPNKVSRSAMGREFWNECADCGKEV